MLKTEKEAKKTLICLVWHVFFSFSDTTTAAAAIGFQSENDEKDSSSFFLEMYSS